jgi:hypothetical protein
MKTLIILALIASSFTKPASAATAITVNAKATTTDSGSAFNPFNDAAVNAKATAHFNAEYNGVDGIWDVNEQGSEVLFFWHDTLMDAFYNKDGDFVGTFHHIEMINLPASALKHIAKEYKGYSLKSVSVMEKDGQAPLYYVTVESPSRMFVLEVNTNGDVSEFKKIR